MKKKILLSCVLCLMGMGQALASDVLTVGDVTVPYGSEATLEVGCEFETEFKAYQIDIELDEGLALVVGADGRPVWEIGFEGTDHSVSATTVAEGRYRFVCTSMSNSLLPMSGALLRVKVVAGEGNVGDSFSGRVTSTEFTAVDYEVCNLEDAAFTVSIGEAPDSHILLDENATEAPEDAAGVDVRVRRTIKEGEWSTICLPFGMTAAQVTAAFGDDVQLADFTGCEATLNEEEDVSALKVNFENVSAIEANHPYLIKVGKPVSEFIVDGVDIVASDELSVDCDENRYKHNGRWYTEYNSFIGTYMAGTEIPELALFLNGNQFWYSRGMTKTKAFRGYFSFYYVLSDMANAETRVVMHFSDNAPSGVVSVHDGPSATDDALYDLQGRRVQKPGKGLYLVNGKKTVIE